MHAGSCTATNTQTNLRGKNPKIESNPEVMKLKLPGVSERAHIFQNRPELSRSSFLKIHSLTFPFEAKLQTLFSVCLPPDRISLCHGSPEALLRKGWDAGAAWERAPPPPFRLSIYQYNNHSFISQRHIFSNNIRSN